jgi:hypothetical protein
MPKSTSLCNSLLALLYNATAIPDVAENDASGPLTFLHVSLHTASLAPASTQSSSETAYTNYARQAVPRTTGGWTAPAGGATQNVAAIEFPQCGVTGATITSGAVGKQLAGAGIVWHYGDLNASIAVSNQIQPRFPAGAVTITES